MRQLSAMPALTANSTARRLSTGSAPGIPRQTGQTLVLGGAPNPVGQPQKILVAVASCACTSRPITDSYLASTSGETPGAMADIDPSIIVTARGRPSTRRRCALLLSH